MDNSTFENLPTGTVMATLAGEGEPTDRPSWYRGFGAVYYLLASARDYIAERIPNFEESPHATTLSEIEGILRNMSLEAAWSNYKNTLRQLVTIALPFVVHDTKLGATTEPLSKTAIVDLKLELEDLIKRTIESSLPSDLRASLVRRLRDLLSSLDRYEIYGIEGIREAAVGVVVTLVAGSDEAKKSPTTRSVLEFLVKLQDLVIKSAVIAQLVGPRIAGLLGAGH
jgi:hypothetical protein